MSITTERLTSHFQNVFNRQFGSIFGEVIHIYRYGISPFVNRKII